MAFEGSENPLINKTMFSKDYSNPVTEEVFRSLSKRSNTYIVEGVCYILLLLLFKVELILTTFYNIYYILYLLYICLIYRNALYFIRTSYVWRVAGLSEPCISKMSKQKKPVFSFVMFFKKSLIMFRSRRISSTCKGAFNLEIHGFHCTGRVQKTVI